VASPTVFLQTDDLKQKPNRVNSTAVSRLSRTVLFELLL
jgi:hypothetical protein